MTTVTKTEEMLPADKAAHILKKFDEEIADVMGYLTMAKYACENSFLDEDYTQDFLIMAKDEYKHANFIYCMLRSFEIKIPTTSMEKYEEMEIEVDKYLF